MVQMSVEDFIHVDVVPDRNLNKTLDLLKRLCAKGCNNTPSNCATYDFYGANRVHGCSKKQRSWDDGKNNGVALDTGILL